jgi:hypothetical protein
MPILRSLYSSSGVADSYDGGYTALLRIMAIDGKWVADQVISIDSKGHFSFNYQSLPVGCYDLHLYLAGMPLHAQRVEIKA